MKDFKKPRSFGAKKPFGSRPSYGAKRGFSAGGPRPFDPTIERFQATCNECHQACEVPFKPNGKKPVYCRNCFKGKDDAAAPRAYGAKTVAPAPDFTKQFDLLNAKLDRLLKAAEGKA